MKAQILHLPLSLSVAEECEGCRGDVVGLLFLIAFTRLGKVFLLLGGRYLVTFDLHILLKCPSFLQPRHSFPAAGLGLGV